MPARTFPQLHPFDPSTLVRFSLGVFLFLGFIVGLRFFIPKTTSYPDTTTIEQTSEIKPIIGNGQENFVTGQLSELIFQLDTENKPIIGAQLVYTVETNVLPTLTADQIVVLEESGFVPLHVHVEPNEKGYIVQLAVRPKGDFSSDLIYANSSFVNIAKMMVTPSGPGDIIIRFDPELSIVLNPDTQNTLVPQQDLSIPVI